MKEQPQGHEVAERLAQDARAREARMLPADGPLNAEQFAFAAKAIAEYLAERDMDASEAATQLGVPIRRSLLIVDGRGEPDRDQDQRIVRRLYRWVQQHREADREGHAQTYVTTGLAAKMIGVLLGTFEAGGMGAIVGCSGVSKSTVCRAMEAGHIPGSVHIELTQGHGRPAALARLIARRVACPRKSGSLAEVMEALIDHLAGTRRLLMVDEAHYLEHAACNVLRDLHKQTGCPIVLVGTRDVLATINDFTEFAGQFKRLFVYTLDISAELAATGDPLYSPREVVKFAASMGLRLTGDGTDYATELACIPGWGGLGSLRSLLLNARLLSPDRAIDAKVLRRALREMEGATGFDRVRTRAAQSQRGKVAVA